jgi:eukaryotic-like serine/threonine-protein kinase
VPLLDGKYEIHGERAVGPGVTAFSATAPDGAPVRVEWLELPPEDEAAFERYRRLLKRLAREGRAAVQDVVARPGARYVAWYLPPDGSGRARDADLESALREAGYDPAGAEVRRVDGHARLVALPFRTPLAAPPGAVTDPGRAAAPTRWAPIASPRARRWAWSLALFATSVALAFVGFARRANDAVVVVPDVVGTAYAEAAPRLHGLGLRVTPNPIATDDHAVGSVLASDPGPGQTLRPGREVRLSVALPSGQLAPTDVPRLVGLTSASAAADALEQAGLRLGRLVRIHVDAPADVVLAQTPAAGSTVGRDAAVDLVLSLGPRPSQTFVPDLVGLTLEDATELAVIAGLAESQVAVERLPSNVAPRDTVLAQSLAPYRDVILADAVLRLIVADGPEVADTGGLPVLGGLSEAEARSLAGGFVVDTLYVSEIGLPDGVVGQSLPPGALPQDGRLVLTVNAQPVPVPIPRVDVTVRQPAPRALPYLWFIEPGIPHVTAEVTATTLEGERFLVARSQVRGGGRVAGTWTTTYPGVVRFELTLNGEPYGGPLRVP